MEVKINSLSTCIRVTIMTMFNIDISAILSRDSETNASEILENVEDGKLRQEVLGNIHWQEWQCQIQENYLLF